MIWSMLHRQRRVTYRSLWTESFRKSRSCLDFLSKVFWGCFWVNLLDLFRRFSGLNREINPINTPKRGQKNSKQFRTIIFLKIQNSFFHLSEGECAIGLSRYFFGRDFGTERDKEESHKRYQSRSDWRLFQTSQKNSLAISTEKPNSKAFASNIIR